MGDIVTAINPTTIASLIEDNTNAYLLSFARLPGAILHETPTLVWLDAGVPDSTLPAGHSMYERLGFRDFCRFHRYVWMPN